MLNMDQDRELFGTEIKELLQESIKRTIEGEFSPHRDDPVFFTKEAYPLRTKIEGLPLFPSLIPDIVRSWANLGETTYKPEDVLVLDLETTGLGRGGIFAFMIGLGYFEAGQFFVEQIFLPDPDAEEHSFERLQELMESRSLLITFNGKSFDVPVLEARLLYHQIWLDLSAMEHLDLLHLARRLWKRKLPSCALETIEFYILGHIRDKELDISGGDVPQTYFNFLSTGDAEMVKRVFVHNHHDILHTAALFALLCDGCKYPPEGGMDVRIDYHALALLYKSQGSLDIARRVLIDLMAKGELNADIALDLGLLYKKAQEMENALDCFQIAAALDNTVAMIEAAKILERQKDFIAAEELSKRALFIEGGRFMQNHKLLADLQKRIERLMRKSSP